MALIGGLGLVLATLFGINGFVVAGRLDPASVAILNIALSTAAALLAFAGFMRVGLREAA